MERTMTKQKQSRFLYGILLNANYFFANLVDFLIVLRSLNTSSEHSDYYLVKKIMRAICTYM